MHNPLLFPLLLLLSILPTSALPPSICHNFTIPIQISYTQYLFAYPQFQNNHHVATFIQDMNRRDAATAFSPISGSRLASGSFLVAGTYCEPAGASTLLLATHGIVPDRGYWDVRYQPGNYSFVEFVVERGYSVLYYDRLGTGRSQVVSGYLLQLPMQISILSQLLTRLRTNTLLPPEIPHTVPKNIVTIGHNIGSRIANAVIATSPSLVDAVISTGLSYRSGIPNSFGLGFATWGGKIARTVDERWGERGYDSGWLDQDDEVAIWTIFYREPFYDTRLVDYMNTLRYPQAIMEISTAPLVNLNTSGFTKPVLFLIGEYDYIQCGGYCPGVLEPAASQAYPNSREFEIHVQPGAAHMLNLAYNATGGYQIIVDFLHKNGF